MKADSDEKSADTKWTYLKGGHVSTTCRVQYEVEALDPVNRG